jgi:hypothetical protein
LREESSTGEKEDSPPTGAALNMVAGRSSSTAQQSGAGKLVKATVGGNLHWRRRKNHFPCKL